jgi:hypothetical protein
VADEWQSAWVEVLPDLSNFRATANPQITSVLSGAGNRGAVAMGSSMRGVFAGAFFGTLLADLGSRIVSSIVGGIRQGIESGLSYTFDAVTLASELEQSVGAVSAVFHEQASIIEGFANQAVESVGLTRAEYQSFATVVGSQLKNLGLPFDEVSGKTNELIQLGADLAATYGGPTSQAVQALSSLLRGERDPIERYGVGLKQVDINAVLASKGLSDLTGEALKQATITATLELLWKQTADAQGQFAKEEATFAGQQQRFNAELAETQTVLGEMLLPTATEFLKVLRDDFLPILQDTVEEVGPILSEALRDSIPSFRDLLAALAPLIPDLVKMAVEILPVLVELLIVLTPLLIDWANNTATAWAFVGNIIDLLQGDTTLEDFTEDTLAGAGSMWEFAKAIGTAIGTAIRSFTDFQRSVGEAIRGAVAFIQSIPTSAARVFANIGSLLVNSGRALIQGFINGVNQMTKPVRDAVNAVMSVVGGFFPRSPAKYGPFAGSGWDAVRNSGRALFQQFDSGFGGELGGGVVIPGLATANAPLAGSSAVGAGGFDPTSLMRALRDYAERDVTVDVDGVTVARASISGSARLTALGAN